MRRCKKKDIYIYLMTLAEASACVKRTAGQLHASHSLAEMTLDDCWQEPSHEKAFAPKPAPIPPVRLHTTSTAQPSITLPCHQRGFVNHNIRDSQGAEISGHQRPLLDWYFKSHENRNIDHIATEISGHQRPVATVQDKQVTTGQTH